MVMASEPPCKQCWEFILKQVENDPFDFMHATRKDESGEAKANLIKVLHLFHKEEEKIGDWLGTCRVHKPFSVGPLITQFANGDPLVASREPELQSF